MGRRERRVYRVAVAAVAIPAIALALVSWRALDSGGATAEASSPADFDAPAQGLVLRLHDLPPGYWATDGSAEFPLPGLGCAAIEPAGPRPRLAAFLQRYSPVGCLALYFRLFRTPGTGPAPLAVGTGALEAGSVDGAEAGLAISRELLGHLLGDELPKEVPAPETVGDATRLYRWEPQSLFTSEESPSSFLVWRSGSVVASIFVTGGHAATNDRAALHFARIQQARIETRTPYTPDEADDSEVPLENPALEVPIYWLEDTFTPGRGLPRLRLLNTISTTGRPLSAPRASLFYVDRLNLEHAEGTSLDLWSRKQWRRLGMNRKSLPDSLRCASARRTKIPKGRAVVFTGFERVRGPCPNRPPGTHTARIYLPRVVVTVQTTRLCATCFGSGRRSYNSFKGMAAIARSLELRPQPPFPTASP